MVFQTLEEFEELYGDIEDVRRFSSQVSDAWVNFAKYGTPSAPGLPVWEAFEEEKRASMVLNTRSESVFHGPRERKRVGTAATWRHSITSSLYGFPQRFSAHFTGVITQWLCHKLIDRVLVTYQPFCQKV